MHVASLTTIPRDPSVVKMLWHSNPYYLATAIVFHDLYGFLLSLTLFVRSELTPPTEFTL